MYAAASLKISDASEEKKSIEVSQVLSELKLSEASYDL